MKFHWDARHQQLVASGNAKSQHDALPLPGGRKVADVGTGELATLLVGLCIPGASHNNGRATNLDAYAAHLAALHKAAGDDAVADWLEKA